MRVICPNCAAEYDVDDALIPAAGREVECAACGHGWHQPGPRMVLRPGNGAESAPDDGPLPPPAGAAARPAPSASAAALAILREEAERELQARAAERAADPARAEVAATTRREDEPAPPPSPEFVEAELVDDAAPLPDPRAMAAGFRGPAPQVAAPAAAAAAARRAPGPARRRGNGAYNAGFGLVLAVSLLAVGAYVAAPSLQDQDRVGAALGEYRAAVDEGRIWLYEHAAPATDRAIAAIREFIDR